MLSKLLYCVQQLNANNSSTYKIKKFKELYDAGYINKELWNLIYDKDVLFHITSDKIDKNLNVCRSNKDYKGDIIELLKDLCVQYSGNTALAIACGFVNIIMDCSKITGVASTGFGVLTNLLKIVHQNNGNIILVNVQQNIYETIELLGFTQFFKIIPTLEEAYSYITQNAGVAGNGEVFPKLVTCPSCAKSLKAQKAGRFRCINCKAIINISETGSVFVE